MKIHELLTERITLPNTLINQISATFYEWVDRIQKPSRSKKSWNEQVMMHHKRLEKTLYNIIVSTYPKLKNKLVIDTQSEYPPYGGFFFYNPTIKKFTLGVTINYNTYTELSYRLKSIQEKKSIIDTLINIALHEITHSIQTLKVNADPTLQKINRSLVKHGTKQEHYLSKIKEIDAQAQTFVTGIIQLNIPLKTALKTISPYSEHSQKIQTSIGSDALKAYHNLFNIKNNELKYTVWKRFLKRVYEKYTDYYTQTNQTA